MLSRGLRAALLAAAASTLCALAAGWVLLHLQGLAHLQAAVQLACALLLAWVAASLGWFATGFVRGQQAIFARSRAGTLARKRVLALAPILAGAALWNAWRRRAGASCHAIVDGLWLGDRTAARSRAWHLVLDLTSEYARPSTTASPYVCLPWMDGTVLAESTLEEAAQMLDTALKTPDAAVLVHCALGRWRSAQVLAYWLQTRRGLSAPQAWELLRARRPQVKVPAFVRETASRKAP